MRASIESAAGFFEGEGCFTLNRPSRGTPRARISINQVALEPLEMFQKAVGRSGSLRWSKNAIWVLEYWRREDVVAIAELLMPLLSQRRQEQGARMLAASKPRRISKDHCIRGHLLTATNIYRQATPRSGRQCRQCVLDRLASRRLAVVS